MNETSSPFVSSFPPVFEYRTSVNFHKFNLTRGAALPKLRTLVPRPAMPNVMFLKAQQRFHEYSHQDLQIMQFVDSTAYFEIDV